MIIYQKLLRSIIQLNYGPLRFTQINKLSSFSNRFENSNQQGLQSYLVYCYFSSTFSAWAYSTINEPQIYLLCTKFLSAFSYSFVITTFLRGVSTALAIQDCPWSIITQLKGVYLPLYSQTSSGLCSGISASYRFFGNARSL